MTDLLRVDARNPDPDLISRAAACLGAGGLVAFPTETVYGLGADALDAVAVRRLFDAKRRPANDPLIVHVLSLDDAVPLVVDVSDAARALASRFWPGPLTLVLRRAPLVPDEVTAGLETVAIRVPAHPVARALLARAQIPVAAPSANLFSRPSPTRAEHVLEDLAGRIDIVLDAGPTAVGIESTVLDLSSGAPRVLRPGVVTTEMLQRVLGGFDAGLGPRETEPMRSPGLLPKHYAPLAPLTLYEGSRDAMLRRLSADARAALEQGRRVGVIVATGDREEVLGALRPAASMHLRAPAAEDDLGALAASIYGTLRELDHAGVDLILVRSFPAVTGLGAAVQDRLRRAASGHVVRCEPSLPGRP